MKSVGVVMLSPSSIYITEAPGGVISFSYAAPHAMLLPLLGESSNNGLNKYRTVHIRLWCLRSGRWRNPWAVDAFAFSL